MSRHSKAQRESAQRVHEITSKMFEIVRTSDACSHEAIRACVSLLSHVLVGVALREEVELGLALDRVCDSVREASLKIALSPDVQNMVADVRRQMRR